MSEGFVGGVLIPGSVNIGPPWILLIPTEEKLEFQVRLGLHRIFRPWVIERQRVIRVFRTRSGLMDPRPSLRVVGDDDDLQWSFRTSSPVEVMRRLEELGYPVDWERRGWGEYH
jgi:hypothetical protein